jgi:hypothetical protein
MRKQRIGSTFFKICAEGHMTGRQNKSPTDVEEYPDAVFTIKPSVWLVIIMLGLMTWGAFFWILSFLF